MFKAEDLISTLNHYISKVSGFSHIVSTFVGKSL